MYGAQDTSSHVTQRPFQHLTCRNDKSTPGNMFRHIVSYRRSLVLILCTILFLEAQADSDICKICTCTSLTTKINCDNRSPASIPQPIPTNVEYLDLQDNNIATIQEGVFTGLKNLKQLILWNNKISTIEEDVFTRLSDLTSLDLDGNGISTIKEGSFNGLSNLTKLDLRNNKISTIKEGTFTRLSNLNYLYLQNNLIEKYEDGAFLFLRSIVEMNFSVDLKRIQSSVYYYSHLENNNLMKCGCHLPAFVNYIKKVYNRIVAVSGKCLEGSGKRIPILDYSQCQNYWLFQRNLQCQACSGISCNDSNVRSCPGAEPVCRFAISMNGVTMKTERSCSTYRKCVEAMRNNNITCNKRTNSTACTGCCVGHLCNKNDFIGWTKSFVFRLIFKKFNEYNKIPAENISRAMEHEFSTMTGNFRVENSGSNRIKIFAIYCTVFSEMTESQLRRNISQVLNKSQALHNIGVQKRHMKFIDERNIDCILEEVLDVSQKSVYFKEDFELAVDVLEKMVPLVSTVSANITLNHTLRNINNLLNIPEEVLAETEQENRSPNRLLHLIQEIPEKIPLEEQQVTAIYSNLGIGAAKVKNDTFDGLFYGVSYGTNEPKRKTMINPSPNPDQQEADAKIMASISLPRSLLTHLKDEERSSVSRITFFSMRDDKLYRNANKPQCVYWDESSGLDPHWSLNGCNVSNFIPGKEVTCSCDRLKSFAVLMDVYQKEGEKENANYLSIVSNAGFGISFVCLVLTIIIHVCFREEAKKSQIFIESFRVL
ncbi:adhesion G-protein coupled receptor G6-like [Octopus vulgaris]|uniref:Adhesion G-protein coupled receptor G6-like n=1 Tax=Octopus vulgaris TaxID=6645 RepID=A0AA36C3G8_OCTVU|nr:adhesion G-protein coupled receptor G6-like [Octopus vulgaris]